MNINLTREDWQRIGEGAGWLKSAGSDTSKCRSDLEKSIEKAKLNGDRDAEKFLRELEGRIGGDIDDLGSFIEMNREMRNITPPSVTELIRNHREKKPRR